MGIFDILGALAKVSAERRARSATPDFAAIDPDTGQRAFENDPRPSPPQGVGFLSDVVSASQGRVTSTAAERIGQPEATGLSIQELDALLQTKQIPGREAVEASRIAANEALAEKRRRPERRSAGATGAVTDKDRLRRLQGLEKMLSGRDGLVLEFSSPDRFADAQQEVAELQSLLKVGPSQIKPTPTGKPTADVTPKGKIRIKVKATKQSGTVDEKDFNPKTMEKIGG